MAELVSREKELFKINQELNQMTLNPGGTAEAAYPVSGGVAQSRYGTYHKQKGPSTLLKKKAAGAIQTKHKVQAPKTPPLEVARLTKAKTADWKQTSAKSTNNSPTTARFESKYSTYTRGGTSRTATFVKYRNPHFSESPSLDQMLRGNVMDSPELLEVEVIQKRESTTVVNGNSKKQLTQDNFIKFLKAKVAILEEDHAQHASELTRQKEQLDQALEAQRKSDSQRELALSSNKHLSEQLQRAEHQCEEANRRNKDRQQEFSQQQRDLEQLKRDAKILKQTNTNLENRLSRAQEETEAARQALNELRVEQRDQQEITRKELKVKDNRIRTLKRQRCDLLNAYKKQLFMIDNLKRQSSCMEQSVAIGFGEKEFNKVLDWNAKS